MEKKLEVEVRNERVAELGFIFTAFLDWAINLGRSRDLAAVGRLLSLLNFIGDSPQLHKRSISNSSEIHLNWTRDSLHIHPRRKYKDFGITSSTIADSF